VYLGPTTGPIRPQHGVKRQATSPQLTAPSSRRYRAHSELVPGIAGRNVLVNRIKLATIRDTALEVEPDRLDLGAKGVTSRDETIVR
jgi:hypothetical protein